MSQLEPPGEVTEKELMEQQDAMDILAEMERAMDDYEESE